MNFCVTFVAVHSNVSWHTSCDAEELLPAVEKSV